MIPKTETFAVKRITRADDGLGGQTETVNSVGTLPGHLRELDQKEIIELQKVNIQANYRFYSESFDLKPDDYLEKDGVQYQIKNVKRLKDMMGRIKHLEVLVNG